MEELELELEPCDIFNNISEESYNNIIENLKNKIANDYLINDIQAARSLQIASNKYVALI